VKDLCYVYIKYAERKQLKSEILFQDEGVVSIMVSGQNADTVFQHEVGKHCVQRVPPTENKGRAHTSIISVAVLPLLEQSGFKLNNNEVDIEAARGSGPGGQHRNKTSSMIRAKHLPTGIVVCIDGRDQHQNKKRAIRILSSRVAELYQSQKQSAYDFNRKRQLDGGGRSNKIRTYNFVKNRVVDHRLNKKSTRIDEIMKGRLDLLLGV